MHVTKLYVRNFKRFEAAVFELGPFNVVVGPNNSGKSTLLQAMALLQFCVRSTLQKRNSSYELTNISLGQEEFAVIPAAEPLDLWKDRKAQKGGKHIKVEIEAELSNETVVVFLIDLTYNRFGIQPELKAGNADDLANLNITFLPGYAGFLPREERRTPAVRQSLIAQGRHGEIIRNILLDLHDTPDSYQEFRSLLRQVFPDIELTDPSFDDKTDLYIHVRYLEDGSAEERKRKGTKGLDLISAGSGFHQFLQIFSNILAARPSTVLLDEPDAHLYPSLQKDVLRLLHALVRDGKTSQIVLATHSSEFISRVPPNEILIVGTPQPRRLSGRADVGPVLQELGSVDNIALLNLWMCGRIVVTEDREDASILEQFLRTLWGPDRYRRFSSRVVFLPLGGTPLNRDMDAIVGALRAVTGGEVEISLFVVSDRDYLFDSAREEKLRKGNAKAGQQWVIWRQAEIENYLLQKAALQRLCGELERGPLFQVTEDGLEAKLEDLVEQSRTNVLDKLMNRFDEEDRRRDPASCRRLAEDWLEREWHGDRRFELSDAKEVVLPSLRDWLQREYMISFSNERLASGFLESEIPAEMKEVGDQLLSFAGLAE